MAIDLSPTTWLGDGYSVEGNAIKLATAEAGATATLPELELYEADAANGDIRRVAFALAEALYQAFEAQPLEDRPEKMSVRRSSQNSGSLINHTYVLTFSNVILKQEVADEPGVEPPSPGSQ